ncbi:J domain-containing protein [Helicobacter fennelliae]|uniref:J domain-containing protein n=2 Tax=Helicobacter fennelliae TaxID=215 RepID=T1DVK0_9HELI|nr:J domain-containing protein [Helicobacter fennelliae]GAD18808.1 hypothetical protein HFN_2220 [Helicobacter fennelliae MRY12-0050]SQB97467.1 heat shock protein DnaJ domain-containing protein [Helicobacter fennelliae]STP07029.1 heat shock protein DnaJ domain-containing protein [Helicobacter fennelliae]STQ83424.1 heat shock protein DnaJ domain-containing protein [Helicobacter fennelliae]
MNIRYCDRYVQIELLKDTKILGKVLDYASKHFSKRYHLSSSLLILDDGERFKKDYLINWTYHATLQSTDGVDLEEILKHSYLPIRIKIISPNDMLKKVKVHIHLSNLGQVILRLDEDNRVAKRYIRTIFGNKIVYEMENEFCINGVGYSQSMWEDLMELVSSRIIHNVALEFEYQKPESSDSFLTREEYLLRKSYSELNAKYNDDFENIKKQYLKLAKLFHPDNAHGKDEYTIQVYQDRFNKISQAYQMIKNTKRTIA